MPKIYHSPSSPYSSKVRMAARHAGVENQTIVVDTDAQAQELGGFNPLGKIPIFVTDEGQSIFDSRTITQYLNRVSPNALFPRNAAKRLEAEQLESLADGICDCLLAHVYERRSRSADKVHQPWLDKQWSKVERALDVLNANPPKIPAKINAGHIALRSCLAYLDLRFAGQWERNRKKLQRWAARFDEKFPDLKAYLPVAA